MTVKDLPSPFPNSNHILLLGFLHACMCVYVCVCELSELVGTYTGKNIYTFQNKALHSGGIIANEFYLRCDYC